MSPWLIVTAGWPAAASGAAGLLAAAARHLVTARSWRPRRWRSGRRCWRGSVPGGGRAADRLREGRGRRDLRPRSPSAGRCCGAWVSVPKPPASRPCSAPSRSGWRGLSARLGPPGRILPGFGLVGQRERVDAVAQPGVGGPVAEHVAQVAAAAGTQDLGPRHAEAAVGPLDDGAGGAGPVEARPARPRFELGVGVEQLGAAAGAAEHTLAVDVEQVTGPGRLGAGAPQHARSGPRDSCARHSSSVLVTSYSVVVVPGPAGEHGDRLPQAARPAAAVPMRKRKLSV